jgi:drug/metabolite transporter (DMT)-like permease
LIYLIGSIILTSYLVLSFKVVERLRLNSFQVIVFNYITCVITGSLFNGRFPVNGAVMNESWFMWAAVMGSLFISLFTLVAATAQHVNVAVASVAYKLSLVIPFIFSIYLYNEPATLLKIIGIVVALLAVLLTCWPSASTEKKNNSKRYLLFVLPVTLFFGSGLLDTMIKYVEQAFLNDNNKNDYLVTAFASAAVIGIVLLIAQLILGKQKFSFKAVLMGIAIGIPNYFSIWCLVQVLKIYPEDSSTVIPVNNMGIVLFGTVVAWLLFRERLSWINWAGVFLSLAAIALIAFG